MDIGTLTGQIELEDQMSEVLTKVNALLVQFGDTAEEQLHKAQSSMTLAATVGSFFGNVMADMAMKGVSWFKNLASDSIMAGARLEQLGVATRFLGEKAGYSGPFVDNLAKEIQRTGISGVAARESMLQLLGANIDLGNAAKLSAIAQNIQGLSGRTSSEVFEVLARAIATGNTQLLRNVGITDISIDSINRQRKEITGTTSAMTGAERSTTILNAILEKGAGFAGLYGANMQTAGKQASSAARAWDEVSEEIGTVLLPITQVAIGAWYKLGGAVRDVVMDAQGTVKPAFTAIGESLQEIITKLGDVAASSVTYLGQAAAFVLKYRDAFEVLTAAMVAYLGVSVAVKAWLIAQPIYSAAVTAALYLQAFGWEAVGLAIQTAMGPVGWATIAITALYAAWKLWNWGDEADNVEKLVPPVKEVAAGLSEAELAARRAAIEADRLAASQASLRKEMADLDARIREHTVGIEALTIEQIKAIEGYDQIGVSAADIAKKLDLSEIAIKKVTDALKAQKTASDALWGISNQLLGIDDIKRATDYAEAIEKAGIDITTLSEESQKEIASVMDAAVQSMLTLGLGTDELSSKFQAMSLKATQYSREMAAEIAKIGTAATEAKGAVDSLAEALGLIAWDKAVAAGNALAVGTKPTFTPSSPFGGFKLPQISPSGPSPVQTGLPPVPTGVAIFDGGPGATIEPTSQGPTVNMSGMLLSNNPAAKAEVQQWVKEAVLAGSQRRF